MTITMGLAGSWMKCRGVCLSFNHKFVARLFLQFSSSTNIKYLASESNKFRSQCLTYGFRLQSDVGWICKWLVIIMFMHISSGFRLTNVFLVCLFVFFFRWIHLENLWQRQQEKCIATETTRNCFSRSLKKNGKGSRRETTPTTGDRRTEVQRSTYPEMEMENRTETTIPLDWKKFLKAAFRPIKSYYILINSAADKSQKLWDTLTLDVVDAD